MSKKIHVSDILTTVEELTDDLLMKDEGVQMGDPKKPVTKATVCWTASRNALLSAEQNGSDLVICHESLFYPYDSTLKEGQTQDWEAWPTNRKRREIIERSGIALARVHGSADKISIFDHFAEMLELGKPAFGTGWYKVYDIEPTPISKILTSAKKAVGMDHVRTSCTDDDLDQKVSRVGLPWGGLGIMFNVSYQQWLIEQNCDILIAGEADSYGFRFAAEIGIPMIETSHEGSEIPGLRRFTDMLAEKHPEVSFDFYDNGCIWRWV